MELALKCVTEKYATFTGRARRQEFWMFVLAYIIVYLLAIVIDMAAGLYVVTGILGLALLIPTIAVTVRRLHDINRTGWWILIYFVPLIGAIVMLVFCCLKGTAGENRFGEDPVSTEG
ncbi:MAG: DUF805 domain-containing protein [Pseudomonadota bacterium]|nr:DUF805 domain-containing protein [Pseudomonadota bacterium]